MLDKIRVLIIDDLALTRESLKSILDSDASIEVVGMAKDGKEGVEKTFALKPDVITMDIKMPEMSGLEAIERIMEDIPTSIIIVSAIDVKTIVKGLTIGAMDFVLITHNINEFSNDLISKVKIASRVKPIRRIKTKPIRKDMGGKKNAQFRVVTIGISTGGPQALQLLFSGLPQDFPFGILVVQHIFSGFIDGLVGWLKVTSPLRVKIAEPGDVLEKGNILFAPDGYNMTINNNAKINLKEDATKKMLYVPSIDEMMMSVAGSFGENAIGVIMTGMGKDGVEGIGKIREAGGQTIAQDEASSVIFGMNQIAIKKGYVDRVVPLEQIADAIIRAV